MIKYLLVLLPTLLIVQEQIAKGVILDKETDTPIPYVNISILDSKVGTSSDEDGQYRLEIEEIFLDKNIHLSSLGYKDTILLASTFLKLKTIKLIPLYEELDEVIIPKKFKEKFTEINKIKPKKLRGGYAAGTKPWILALYFPFNKKYKETEYLNQLKVYVNRSMRIKKYQSKFRIRIYNVDKNGMPGEDILLDDIIAETEDKQNEVVIDLSEYNLIFPSDGLYVALEGLAIPYNAFEDLSTYVNSKGEKTRREVIRYSPYFSATVEKKDDFKVVKFDNGKWYDFKVPLIKKDETFVPAISLTLSN